MSRLCWDFLTVCTFPKGVCCHPTAGLSPNPLSFLHLEAEVSLQHVEAGEDRPSGTPGHLGLRGMLSLCLCPVFLQWSQGSQDLS